MVEGLARFADHFETFTDNYVLIGGTACDLAMQIVGRSFRATKDLDIVLFLDQNRDRFVAHFWDFIRLGDYQNRQQTDGRPQYYRFTDPQVAGFPFMLELFSAIPTALAFEGQGHLTRIPTTEEVSSLSAILLDDNYASWIQAGKTISDKVAFARAEHLIPLKASAWLNLRERKQQGGQVDERDIKKHKNDVFRLLSVVDPEYHPTVPSVISTDMERFVELMASEAVDLKSLGLKGISLQELLDQLEHTYVIPRTES